MRKHERALRLWTDFRAGYATYLVFVVGMSNFVLIAYNFAPWVSEALPLWQFVIVAGAILVPVALTLGRIHHSTAYKADRAVWTERDYYRDRAIPNSKEIYEARFRRDMAGYMAWQAAAMRRLLMDTRPGEHTDDQVSAMAWEDTMGRWREKHAKFMEGEEASRLP